MLKENARVAVVGAGIMGSGIAQVAARAGFRVPMVDVETPLLERGLEAIRKSLERMKTAGKLGVEEARQVLERIEATVDLTVAARDADLVIEAVPEDPGLKKQVFAQLDRLCKPEAILATNTSTISITEIASATRRPENVIGMHFANPVPVTRGVEIIRGLATSEGTLEAAKDVVRRVGKEYYVCRDSPGFIGNRMLPLFLNEAFNVLHDGIASAEDIDKSAKLSLNHPMGPLELADLIGLDQLLKGMEYLHRELGEKYRPSPLLKQLVAAGRFGRKTGRGVYTYG